MSSLWKLCIQPGNPLAVAFRLVSTLCETKDCLIKVLPINREAKGVTNTALYSKSLHFNSLINI